MPLTPAQQYAANANAVIAFVQALEALRATGTEIATATSNGAFSGGWGVLQTVTLNSDGTAAANDGSAVNGHQIDAAKYGITGYYTASQLAAMLALVESFNAFLAGSAVASSESTPGTLQSVSPSP